MFGTIRRAATGAIVLTAAGVAGAYYVDEYKSGIEWPKPEVVDPGDAPNASRPCAAAVGHLLRLLLACVAPSRVLEGGAEDRIEQRSGESACCQTDQGCAGSNAARHEAEAPA